MLSVTDLWPDFDISILEEPKENNSIKIIREQARILGKKLENKVKATFSKVHYHYREEPTNSLTSAFNTFKKLNMLGEIDTKKTLKKEETLEEELQGKIDASSLIKEQQYKFEIYNEKYRFRLFVYTYTLMYPNKILIDENIAKEIDQENEVFVENDRELRNLLHLIFSSQKVRHIIKMMMLEENL